MNDHPGEIPLKYQFKVKKTFKSSLERQIYESVMIDQQDRSQILNSRSEWGSNRIPRLMVDPDSTGQGQGDISRPDSEESGSNTVKVRDQVMTRIRVMWEKGRSRSPNQRKCQIAAGRSQS